MTIHEILKKFWGYDSFRPLQEEVIKAVLSGNDTLALLPTSAGKSICFQVPAMAIEGICIVVTPLIALMKNQVENLRNKGIKAVAIYSGMHHQEIDTLLDNCVYGEVKFLYVSPERLTTPLFIERVKRMNINLLAIDEAHCISEWGYDFRPAYLKIIEFKALIPTVNQIALSASATKEVALDICERLNLKNPKQFRLSFARKNISYSVIENEDKDRKLLDILTKVKGTNIIYVRSRKRAKSTSDWLNSKGFNTDFYHAGLAHDQRNSKQDNWIKGKTNTIVATNAFGMGIDKSNVRLVIHLDLPESLEAYYQEAGRAGRDELKAYAVILYTINDANNLITKIEEAYPPTDYLRRVYQMLANFYHIPIGGAENETFPFNSVEFQQNFDLKIGELFKAIKILESEGFIQLNEAFNNPSKIQIIVNNNELYSFRLTNERVDNFIKLLLRMYGGDLFTDFQTISETLIAKNYLLPVVEIVKLLDFLHSNKIINYLKQSNLPTITYLSPRYDAKLLPIKEQNILFRKNRDLNKAKAMINFANQENQCRSKIILEYFNEIVESDCGICDNCLKNKKLGKNFNEEIGSYQVKITLLLEAGPMSAEQLKNTIFPKSEKLFTEAIELLLENDHLIYTHNGDLILKN
ncbi:MAG: ATP-dependent DNA helicase RecQ [Bacteroidota bacterium]